MLPALPYHHTSTRYFRDQPAVWQFFASHTHKEEQLREFKTELLKNTYKFTEDTHADLYQKVSLAKEKLGLTLPVVVYQAQHTEEMNANIIYINQEAHIVFSGKLLSLLSEDELLAVISHELSHIQLYTQLNGDIEITDRIITAIGNHYGSTSAHFETARLFRLYTEIFCDRGAYAVTGTYEPIISSLVKISTGLQTVNADSYIKQAEEIFDSDSTVRATGISHPENFIRAKAISLWHSKGPDADPLIYQMIEGNSNLDELDLFKQQQITTLTRQLITLLLHPQWMQTPRTIALGKQYFGDIELSQPPDKTSLITGMQHLHANIQGYFSYILYDFATSDKELEDVPLGYCFYLADELKLDKVFAAAVKKERKITDKKLNLFKQEALSEFHKQSMQSA